MPPFPIRNQIDADARPGERQPWVTPEIEVLPRRKSYEHGSSRCASAGHGPAF
ncbi:MAG TPA: hypothetical protein VFE05_03735 [Longimicrobiaceae bacterium]|jgi:hypothetical protein|nr:hypothetical protein [Longimicrobiaceae bacterium]